MQRPSVKRWLWRASGGRWGLRLQLGALAFGIVELWAPAALAFPHRQTIGTTTILSEEPIASEITQVLRRADTLLAASPINVPDASRQVVLTNGGWRWKVLSLNLSGAIALRRPFSNVLIFNASDVAADRVSNGAGLRGVRTLSGTIAHETAHLLVARRYGELRAMQVPAWLREGYADHVAGETSLDPRALDPHARVLVYYEGRRRVAAELRRSGGSVDALFAR